MCSFILHKCYCELFEAYKKMWEAYQEITIDYGKEFANQLLTGMYWELRDFPEHNEECYLKELEKYKVEGIEWGISIKRL